MDQNRATTFSRQKLVRKQSQRRRPPGSRPRFASPSVAESSPREDMQPSDTSSALTQPSASETQSAGERGQQPQTQQSTQSAQPAPTPPQHRESGLAMRAFNRYGRNRRLIKKIDNENSQLRSNATEQKKKIDDIKKDLEPLQTKSRNLRLQIVLLRVVQVMLGVIGILLLIIGVGMVLLGAAGQINWLIAERKLEKEDIDEKIEQLEKDLEKPKKTYARTQKKISKNELQRRLLINQRLLSRRPKAET